jgi:perosamine synthetase
VEYVHKEIGYNYRLTNIQAAMGCAQMEVLDDYIQTKRDIAARYSSVFADLPGVTIPREATKAISTFWLYTALFDEKVFGIDCRSLLQQLAQVGIETRPLWQPLHQSAAHAGAFATECSVSEALYRKALSLPCSVGLTPSDQQRVISALCQTALTRTK